jgi:hypothetical protein
VTRFPCTEKGDGLVLNGIMGRTSEMTKKDWEYFKEVPCGFLIFSSEGSIPERINGSDLDGDHFSVCWDDAIISYISSSQDENQDGITGTDDDSLVGTSFKLEDIDGKLQDAMVIRNHGDSEFEIGVGTETTVIMKEEEIWEGRKYVDEFLNHRGEGRCAKVEVKWGGAKVEVKWESLSHMRFQVPDMVAEYARKENLLDVPVPSRC